MFRGGFQMHRLAAAALSSHAAVQSLLGRRTVVMVGLSADPMRPSYHVGEFLQQRGYKIIPVRPGKGLILGEPIVNQLSDVPPDVMATAVVDVFRRNEDLDAVVDEVITAGGTGLWLQLGLTNESAIKKAVDAGLTVVADKCIRIELEHGSDVE